MKADGTIVVTDRERALAAALLSPARRDARDSTVTWERRALVDTRYGPLATWSAGAGATVLLVHGWEADHTDMDAFVAPLLASGRRVATFDLPAHGASDGDAATLPELARALEDVAAAYGPVDAVVAHSVGCAASAVALAGGLRARRVAFVAPPLRYEAYVRFVAERRSVDGDALVAALAERGLDVAPLDIRANAAGLDVPLLIVHSRDDRTCDPTNATEIAAVWRGSDVRFVDGLGHSRILRDDAVVRSVVDFVAGTTSIA